MQQKCGEWIRNVPAVHGMYDRGLKCETNVQRMQERAGTVQGMYIGRGMNGKCMCLGVQGQGMN